MAAVFTFAWVVTLTALFVAASGVWGARGRSRWRAIAYLPVLILALVALAYLVAKFVYEEIVPCATVDSFYCDFDATQHRNLFGWEF